MFIYHNTFLANLSITKHWFSTHSQSILMHTPICTVYSSFWSACTVKFTQTNNYISVLLHSDGVLCVLLFFNHNIQCLWRYFRYNWERRWSMHFPATQSDVRTAEDCCRSHCIPIICDGDDRFTVETYSLFWIVFSKRKGTSSLIIIYKRAIIHCI